MMLKTIITTILLSATWSVADSISIDFEKNLQHTWQKNATWQIVKEDKNHILSLVKQSKAYFNLYFTKDITFLNGSISVKFKANTGHIDQGGGLMWRVQDKDNYYVARFNPLEDNFRFYIVHHSMRSELASADIKLSKGWHTMKIVQKDNHFEGYLDDKKLLSHEDKQLQKSGGVGIWTKADALTSFDNLNIRVK